MKTHLTLIFILIWLALSAQKYKYVPFPGSNAVWSEVYWKPISQPDPRWVYNQYALFNEDTVINEITYHKLFHTNSSAKITRDNSVCIGGIREDNSKNVWFYCFEYPYPFKPALLYVQNEIKLFDFNVTIGDTIREINFLLEYHYIVVKDIDTIRINNSLRKVYRFDPVRWVYWIEGIGNVKGLLFTSGDLPNNGMDNDLVCMHQNDTLMFYSNAYDGCIPQFVIDDVVLLPNTDIKVYPNPVPEGVVYFENLDFETLELFDTNGYTVRLENIKGISCFELDVLNLPSGIYYYRLKTKGLVPTRGKLIIQ
jgi:hypothetical protein